MLVSEKLPFVGKYVELFEKLSSKGKQLALTALVIFLVYPVVSFFIVMVALGASPKPIQLYARNLILGAIGVDDATEGEINRSNRLIDAEVPLTFSQNGQDVYYQAVSTSQNVQFDGILRMLPLASQPPNCANVTLDLNRTIGTLEILSVDSSYQGHYPIKAFTDQVQRIESIGPAEWKRFLTDTQSNSDSYPLRISFKPDPSLKNDPYFGCYEARLWVTMTIFKPIMGPHQ